MERPYILINKLANIQRRYFDSRRFNGDCSGAQGKVLDFLFQHNDQQVFQKDLEKEFGMRPPTATALLKSMAEVGLIRRQPDPEDARYKRIIPTEKAMSLKKEISDATETLEKIIKNGISEEDYEVWERVMNQMANNLVK